MKSQLFSPLIPDTISDNLSNGFYRTAAWSTSKSRSDSSGFSVSQNQLATSLEESGNSSTLQVSKKHPISMKGDLRGVSARGEAIDSRGYSLQMLSVERKRFSKSRTKLCSSLQSILPGSRSQDRSQERLCFD